MAKVTLIDPPEGWRYGFPMVIPEGAKIAEFLAANGYPKKDIDFAVRWIRCWQEDDDDQGNEQAGPQGEAQGEATEPYRQGPTYSQVPAADRA